MAGDGINKGMRVQPAGVGEDGPCKQAEEDEEGDEGVANGGLGALMHCWGRECWGE